MCGLLDRMTDNRGEREGAKSSGNGPHEEFLELCAVSTSGDLTEEEQQKLQAHLAGCPECRQALKEFETAVDLGVPLLASELESISSGKSATVQREPSHPVSRHGMHSETPQEGAGFATSEGKKGFAFAGRNGYRPSQVNWTYVWMPFAASVLLTVALGIYAYRAGQGKNGEPAQAATGAADVRIEALEQGISDAGREREGLKRELAERDKMIAELHVQTEQQLKSLNEMRSAEANLEHSLQADGIAKQQIAEERASLEKKFDQAQGSLQKLQSELDSISRQRALDEASEASLENQIRDLSVELREREQTVAKQDELLSHDRDIRELMGARDLYVVDVYDVARDGTTQKSTGRIFYTKGKSLIFYAYDLEQEPGAKSVSTFQAWGRRGPDKEKALNLGIFYEDNAAQKRWVLKINDPKTLDEIDAVFVTVEPKGGSHKPSGKPLLSAYLQLASNHP
jgi:hypothetical protein